MNKRILTKLAEHREALDITQCQMAALLKTVQSEVSKTESGELPPTKKDVRRWAKAYRLTMRKFVAMCEAAQWTLPLWRFSCHTPQEIEVIEVKAKTVIA